MTAGRGCEQTAPSHAQQWTNPTAVILETARRHDKPELMEISVQWFLSLFAVSEPFAVESESFKTRWRVISTGARAFKAKRRPGKPLVGGTSYMVDRLVAWRKGLPLNPGNAPLQEIDEAALYILRDLPTALQHRLRTETAPVPPLRWPILLKRREQDFVSYLPEFNGRGVQRLAGWATTPTTDGFTRPAPLDSRPVPRLR